MLGQRDLSSPLWVITSYFNPERYRRRLKNYHAFRRHLNVPVACVEQTCGGPPELQRGDAEILLSLSGGDVMWQKERLLNVAAAALPATCRAVAWVDCDVIFERPDWPELALAALERDPLVHLYESRVDLGPAACGEDPAAGPLLRTIGSTIARGEQGVARNEEYWNPNAPNLLGSSLGLAWAARRELLIEHGLYDACILGTADRVMVCAGCGRFDDAARAIGMNEWQLAHFLAWAEPFSQSVSGRIGHLPGEAYHLWHGEFEHRGYGTRYAGLAPFAFDPFRDLARDAQGAWCWNSAKPAMHQYVREYFSTRREDG